MCGKFVELLVYDWPILGVQHRVVNFTKETYLRRAQSILWIAAAVLANLCTNSVRNRCSISFFIPSERVSHGRRDIDTPESLEMEF